MTEPFCLDIHCLDELSLDEAGNESRGPRLGFERWCGVGEVFGGVDWGRGEEDSEESEAEDSGLWLESRTQFCLCLESRGILVSIGFQSTFFNSLR